MKEMKFSIDEQIKYWLDLASYDIKTAKAMFDTKRYIYVGFMCHQAVEKTLKAYYVFEYKEMPPFIHNLTLLSEKCRINKELSEFQLNLIDFLEPLNVQSRYPKHREDLLKQLSNKKCKDLIKHSKEFCKWITEKLQK